MTRFFGFFLLALMFCVPAVSFADDRASSVSVQVNGQSDSVALPEVSRVTIQWEAVNASRCILTYPGKRGNVSKRLPEAGSKQLTVSLTRATGKSFIVECQSLSDKNKYISKTVLIQSAAANEMKLSLQTPENVVIAKTYPIVWKQNGGHFDTSYSKTLRTLVKEYPSLEGEIIIYNKDVSLGIGQFVYEKMPAKEVLKGKGSWTVGSLSNDGRALPEGVYYMVMVLQTPVDSDGMRTPLAQGVSKDFTVKY